MLFDTQADGSGGGGGARFPSQQVGLRDPAEVSFLIKFHSFLQAIMYLPNTTIVLLVTSAAPRLDL